MIKKIKTPSIKLGMYICAFGEGSHSLNFRRPPFLLERNSTRLRLQVSNIQFVLIDTEMGADGGEIVDDKKNIAPPSRKTIKPKFKQSISAQEELPAAKKILDQVNAIMKSVMTGVRMGKPLEVSALELLSEKIMSSVMRNNSALVSLARIKDKDDYTFMHSVSVAGLLTVLAKENGIDEEAICEVALGGLLHDIGKMITPDEILNKPGALSDEELGIMRNHVVEAEKLIENTISLSRNTLDPIFQHHERIDGSGYPYGLSGRRLSDVGKMSAIADIYDALTSIRVYKCAWEPAFTLKKMMQWTDKHLDKDHLFKFIHCLGVYPSGSFVEMESGRIGVVIDQHEKDITKPLVKFFYNKDKKYTKAEIVDLSRLKTDRILTPVSPEKYGIDMKLYASDFLSG